MVFPFDKALQGINERFQTIGGGGSPFGQNPFGATTPFSNPFGQGGSPQFGGFGNVQSPFGNPFGNVRSPFGSPFSGQSPFGQPSWGTIMNPFTYSPDADPFGTGGSSPTTGGSGGFDWTGPATATDNGTLTAQAIDGFIASKFANSPLRGQGAYILEVANRYGISAPLLIGIAWKESGMGTNVGAGNIFGITDPTRDKGLGNTRAFQSYDGVRAEIEAAARNLASDMYRGKSAAEQIGTWYVGPEEYRARGLAATDLAGNGTVADYLNRFIAPTYQGLGLTFQQDVPGTPTGRTRGNWEQVANSFTREGGGWVDYTNGGIRLTGNPRDGFDCSSFTGYVLGLDKNIWNAQAQTDEAKRRGSFFNNVGQARKGDLIFFQGTNPNDPSARPVSHVGIYLGNGRMIHTGTPGRGVEIVSINTPYWQQKLYGFGRL